MTDYERPDSPDWTPAAVQDLKAELTRFWSARKADDTVRYRMYRGEDVTEVPAADGTVPPKIVKSMLYKELIDIFAARLAVRGHVDIDAYGVGRSPRRDAEAAARFLNTIDSVSEAQSGEDVNFLVTQDALITGYSFRLDLPKPEMWADRPVNEGRFASPDAYSRELQRWHREDAPLPLVSRHISSLKGFPLMSGRRILKMVEVDRVPWALVKRRFGEAAPAPVDPDIQASVSSQSCKDTELVEFVTVVDHEWCGYFCQMGAGPSAITLPLRFWRHCVHTPDKSAPVTIYEALRTSEEEYRWRWSGLLDTLSHPIADEGGRVKAGMLELMDFLLSNIATVVRTHASETVVARVASSFTPQQYTELSRLIKFKVGGTNIELVGPSGQEELSYRRWESPPPLQHQSILFDQIWRRIEMLAPASALGRSAAGDAGYKVNLDTENANQRLDPIADSLARGDADHYRMICYVVRAVGELMGKPDQKVWVRERTNDGTRPIGASWADLAPFINLIRVRREAVSQTDWLMLADALMKWLSDPIRAPRSWALKEIGRIDNPTEWDDERWFEDIMNSPEFADRDRQDILTRLGLLSAAAHGIPADEISARLSQGERLPPGADALLSRVGLGNGADPGEPMAPGEPAEGMPAEPMTAEELPDFEDATAVANPLAIADTGEENAPPPGAGPPPVQSGRAGSNRRQVRRPKPGKAQGRA